MRKIYILLGIILCIGSSFFYFAKSESDKETLLNNSKYDFVLEESDYKKVKANSEWCLMLVNNENLFPEGYEVKVGALPNGKLLDKRILEDTENMINAAKSEGIGIEVISAYRSDTYQKIIFEREVKEQMASGLTEEEAIREAKRVVAYPRTSEHQLGLAIDIITPEYTVLDEGFRDTEAFRWMSKNAHKYGYILRYEEEKKELTDIISEPWHYRYVGKEHAPIIKEAGICLEEYLAK